MNKQFPLYYYIKNTKGNTNIIFREINYNIEAYILDYKYIEQIMKGEYVTRWIYFLIENILLLEVKKITKIFENLNLFYNHQSYIYIKTFF